MSSDVQSPFCTKCIVNQTIVYQALAAYLPDDSDPAFQRRSAGLDDYKSKLEVRFPAVCENCREVVQRTIDSNNYKAKTRALRSLLANRSIAHPSGLYERTRYSLWVVRGTLWWFMMVLFTVWYVLEWTGSRDMQWVSRLSIPSLFVTFYTPVAPGTKVEGLTVYHSVQFMNFLIRLSSSVHVDSHTAIAYLCVHLVTTVYSRKQLSIKLRTIDLVSRNRVSLSEVPTDHTASRQDPLEAFSDPFSEMFEALNSPSMDTNSPADLMEWQPSQRIQTEHAPLSAPRYFGHPTLTGLENYFSAVQLEEVSKSSNKNVAYTVTIAVLGICCVLILSLYIYVAPFDASGDRREKYSK